MKQFDKTTLSQLTEGDMFYFGTNKSKVYKFIKVESKSIFGEKEYTFKERTSRFEEKTKKDKGCIFLRHKL